MNPRQKYPIGIQDFRKLRQNGYVYVDKTEWIHQMVDTGEYYFLSRPRRFGKSLLVNTLKELFSGSQALFEGLWIEPHWDWSQRWPVIVLPFSKMSFQELGLETAISRELDAIAQDLGATIHGEGPPSWKLNQLIRSLASGGQQVVLLIDEYDKPIIEYLERGDSEQAEANRHILRSFYSVLKDNDSNIRFLFMTGVSKFAKMSLFSELNNLQSISLDARYSALLGITQEELEAYFGDRLQAIALEMQRPYADFMAQVKAMYNGYSWLGDKAVYNPFSLLSFLQVKDFRNFWVGTGSTGLLTRIMRKEGLFDPSRDPVAEDQLDKYAFEGSGVVALMFQTGYLTIKDYDRNRLQFHLNYPNLEVKSTVLNYLFTEITQHENFVGLGRPYLVELADNLREGRLSEVMEKLNIIFSLLPYDLWPEMEQRGEKFFHAMFHVIFTLMGTYVQSEVHSSKGRCDALVLFPERAYVFEFKVDEPVDQALAQIRDRDYLAPYRGTGRVLVGVGVSFSRAKKGIEAWQAIAP